MQILSSDQGDPMIVDSGAGLAEVARLIDIFLGVRDETLEIATQTHGNPAPYDHFLNGLRLIKSPTNKSTQITEDGWITITADTTDLRNFSERFTGVEDGTHQRWYGNPVSLIIEADDDW